MFPLNKFLSSFRIHDWVRPNISYNTPAPEQVSEQWTAELSIIILSGGPTASLPELWGGQHRVRWAGQACPKKQENRR